MAEGVFPTSHSMLSAVLASKRSTNNFAWPDRRRPCCFRSTFASPLCLFHGTPSLFFINLRVVSHLQWHISTRSFSILGMVPGVIVTLAVAVSVQYTSLILWRFCLKHPEIRDVCDIGQMLFGGSKVAYNITAVFFILNNTFIQGTFPPLYSRLSCLLPWNHFVTSGISLFYSVLTPQPSSTPLSRRRRTSQHPRR